MKTQYLVSFLIIRIFNAIANIISFLHNFIYLYAFIWQQMTRLLVYQSHKKMLSDSIKTLTTS